MAKQFNYRSVLAPYMQRLIDIKESEGRTCISLKFYLKEFDNFAMSRGLKDPHITQGFIEAWRKSRLNDSNTTLYTKYGVWIQLTKLMSRYGVACFIPQLPRFIKSDFIPYIFSEEQILQILREADNYRPCHFCRNSALISMPAALRTIYSGGLREDEAVSLKNEDVHLDEGYIVIRKTKNNVQRIVALKDSMKRVLKQYVEYRDKIRIKGIDNPKNHFFVKCDGTPFSPLAVYVFFKKILDKCGIPHVGNHHGPRVHDLRHTYAVHSLAQIARSGEDVYTWLPALSASLGHLSLKATEQYVRLTKELYPDVAEKCSEINKFIFPKYYPRNDDYSD